jgi:hypothetical protein
MDENRNRVKYFTSIRCELPLLSVKLLTEAATKIYILYRYGQNTSIEVFLIYNRQKTLRGGLRDNG